jgi:hypothetical protein
MPFRSDFILFLSFAVFQPGSKRPLTIPNRSLHGLFQGVPFEGSKKRVSEKPLHENQVVADSGLSKQWLDNQESSYPGKNQCRIKRIVAGRHASRILSRVLTP